MSVKKDYADANVVDILIAISMVSNRLAKKLLILSQAEKSQEGGKDDGDNSGTP